MFILRIENNSIVILYYGLDNFSVFIINNLFTEQACKAATEGKPITLIDGSELVNLVIKYRLYITPVTTYVLDDFYLDE